ncbi:vitamin K epoxide reductase family protein [Tenacibaculum sp.]|nr:vitamin K epoxide reductase family protein [Tenacibaculum sp.]
MKDSIINLVQVLLKKNKIPFDKDELNFQIQSHPSYPSLHAITGVLDHFNIDNIAADVPVNTDTLIQLPNCFLIQVKTDNEANFAVLERKGLDYSIYDTDKKKEKISEEDLLEKFTGIIVAVEKTEDINFTKKVSTTPKLIGIGLLLLFTAFISYKSDTSWHQLIYLILSIIGISISLAITKQELGIQTSLGSAFCSDTDDKKDCDAVLTSKGAEIIKGYKLSDFSLLYFISLTLFTFTQIANPIISYNISLLVIPVTLYSIYYQYAIIKKWCLLCLSIVAVLWLQASITVLTSSFFNDFITFDFALFGLILTATWLTWSYAKPTYTEVQSLRKEKVESTKFKRNFTLFSGLLQKSVKLNTAITDTREIIFGNPKSLLELVIITNPFCGHCKSVHENIHQILNKYGDKVKVKIRFNINTKDNESDVVKITNRLLEIYHVQGRNDCLLAMNDIYQGDKSSRWLKKWGNSLVKENYITELEKENEWCSQNAINFTPEILINGRSFPKEYNRSDLILFIEELEEKTNNIVIPIKEIQSI